MKADEIALMMHQNYLTDNNAEVRNYLGMSGIGGCPREQYMRMVNPQPPDERLIWYGFVGYAFEDIVCRWLGGEQDRRTLVANFDSRYRGHTDYSIGNTLVEIKSVSWTKYCRIWSKREPVQYNVDQCQAYMEHGGFEHCVLIYAPRDIPHREWDNRARFHPPLPFWCVDVFSDENRQRYLDSKAMLILCAVDGHDVPPSCTCGWCKR